MTPQQMADYLLANTTTTEDALFTLKFLKDHGSIEYAQDYFNEVKSIITQ